MPESTQAVVSIAMPAGAAKVLHDKYELIRPVGEGGMGVVWIAHDRVLDVAVALKLGHQSNGPDSTRSVSRALSEARLAAQLKHPAICRVLDFGLNEDGAPFVVSELLHGQNLAQALSRKKRLSPIRAVQTLLPIVDALAAAHERGIVHRDVKPANIFLAQSMGDRVEPKLLDFGIARLVHERSSDDVSLGTPCYMSPEQARGEVVDFRSDIWSLCVTLYELVTGVVPFLGDDYDATRRKVEHSEPLLITQHSAGDVRLARIIEHGMNKDPELRYGSAKALASELAGWLLGHGQEEDAYGQSLRARLGDMPSVAILTPAFGRPLELLPPDLTASRSLPTKLVRVRGVVTQPSPRRAPAVSSLLVALVALVALLSLLGCGAWFAYN